jgi:hypothetical protein
MKNPSKKLLILIFVLTASLMRAQTDTDSGPNSDVIAASQLSSAATNEDSTSNTVARAKTNNEKSSDATSAQVNATGIHVGGAQPVAINWGNGPGEATAPILAKNLVTLAAVVCPFIFAFFLPVAILAIIFVSKHRRNKMVHETLRAMIEKGMPVTPELLAGLREAHFSGEYPSDKQSPGDPFGQVFSRRQRPRNRHLLPGLILTGFGLGLIVTQSHFVRPGLIILLVGLSFLIVWWVERKQNADDERSANMPNEERKRDNDQQPPKV